MRVRKEARCKKYLILKKWLPHVIWKCLLVYEPALQAGEWGQGVQEMLLVAFMASWDREKRFTTAAWD
jgi:hypothetical protein